MVVACTPAHPLARPARSTRPGSTARSTSPSRRGWSSARRSIASCAATASASRWCSSSTTSRTSRRHRGRGRRRPAARADAPPGGARRLAPRLRLAGCQAGAAAGHHPPPASPARQRRPRLHRPAPGQRRRRAPAANGRRSPPALTRHAQAARGRGTCHDTRILPPQQGLYDPRYEHDSCGVGFVVDLKGRKSHDIIRKAHADPRQPGAPRRVRLREEHRRRRRHPPPDARTRFLASECDRLGIDAARAGEYGVGLVFLPTDPPTARSARASSSRSSARRGRPSSAGATCPPTTR